MSGPPTRSGDSTIAHDGGQTTTRTEINQKAPRRLAVTVHSMLSSNRCTPPGDVMDPLEAEAQVEPAPCRSRFRVNARGI